MLPYLASGRSTCRRWPDGVDRQDPFWQKQIPVARARLDRALGLPRGGLDRVAHVCRRRPRRDDGLARQPRRHRPAPLDVHDRGLLAPHVRADRHRPGHEDDLATRCVTLARLYRTALEHLDVSGVPKVTGKRGIQIWVPIEPALHVRRDARLGRRRSRAAVGAAVPDLVSWEWGKAVARGKARLDFTQNAINKTLVAPYAVRPVANAAVSAPIDLGRARRRHAQTRCLGHARDRGARREGRGPLQGLPR